MTSTNDDQEYYAKIYVDENLRRHFNISIDYQSQLFQTIEGALNPVRLHYEGEPAFDIPFTRLSFRSITIYFVAQVHRPLLRTNCTKLIRV